MHTSLVRIQNSFGFFTTVAFTLGLLIAVSDLFSPRTPSVGTLATTNVQVVRGRPHYYSSKKEEYAIIKFSLDADLSSLFTWNTKQLFVYVTAEWPSTASAPSGRSKKDLESSGDASAPATNQAIIWDAIITAPSSDHLANIGPAAMKKLRRSAGGKSIDPSRGILSLKNQRPKYQITHPSGRLAEASDVVLRLHYNVQPWVGVLTWNQDSDIGPWKSLQGAVSRTFSLPPLKKKDGEA